MNSTAAPAAAGSLVQIFATGYGSSDVQVYFAESPAEVTFSGPLAQFPGLWQINVRVPANTSGQVSLFVLSGGLWSNGVTIAVR